jgi:hypothetical protein
MKKIKKPKQTKLIINFLDFSNIASIIINI